MTFDKTAQEKTQLSKYKYQTNSKFQNTNYKETIIAKPEKNAFHIEYWIL